MGDCYLYGKSGGGETAQRENIGLTVLRGGSRPQSPGSTTVWLNTDQADTDLMISQIQPTGAEGKVWLQLKDDGTRVTLPGPPKVELPIRFAHIYTNKAWQRLEGWLYSSGAWKQFCSKFDGRLYVEGDTCDDFSGGWSFDEYQNTYISGSGKFQAGTLLEDRMELHSITDNPVILGTRIKIPLSGFSTMSIDWRLLENYNTGTTNLALAISNGTDAVSTSVTQAFIGGVGERKTTQLNIAKLTGEYYISVRIVPAKAGIRGEIYNITLS